MSSDPDFLRFRDAVASTVRGALDEYSEIGDSIAENSEQPPGFDQVQRDATDYGVELTRVSRTISELYHENQGADPALRDLKTIQPLLQALAESFILIGLTEGWGALREQLLLTPDLLDALTGDEVVAILREAGSPDVGG
ncbi:MAG TPA: hypothetical protein VIJ20_09555 [Solirubrobacteraceae bacterium]